MKFHKEFILEFTVNADSFILRSIKPSDRDNFIKAFKELSHDTIKMRFFSHKKGLTNKEIQSFTEVDFNSHIAMVLIEKRDDTQYPVGTARFFINQQDKSTAEFAITLIDKYQSRGLGTVLFNYLIEAAREREKH